MVLNREYNEQQFFETAFSEDHLILSSFVNESECDSFSIALKERDSFRNIISFDYRITDDNEMINDEFRVVSELGNEAVNYGSFVSISDLDKVIGQINSISKKIIVDFTLMHLRFLGALVAVLDNYSWDSVFFTYSEPISYPRENETKESPRNERIAGFDLYSNFLGYSQIPFLTSVDEKREKSTWIVFLGFEGKRADAIYHELADTCDTIIPVITYPSIKPGWANYTYEANQFLFNNTSYSQSDIMYIDALNPFQTFTFMAERFSDYSGNSFIVSPFSSRPISLGVFLYAMKNERCEVFYDNPVRAHSNVKNLGKIHFYDLLDFYKNELEEDGRHA